MVLTRTPLVLCSTDGSVVTLTLNRPDKLNALTPQLFVELRDHIDAIGERSDVACVILTGAGRSFCAGHSLDVLGDGDAEASRFHEAETIDALEGLPVPTIAKIRGHCFTGGLELALACDLIVSTSSAIFADTHGQWGLVPVWGMSVRLPERIGITAARDMSFTSRRIDGATAATLGLVSKCVADAELDGAVTELTDSIVANSAQSNRMIKQLYATAMRQPRRDALLMERALVDGLPTDSIERLSRGSRPDPRVAPRGQSASRPTEGEPS